MPPRRIGPAVSITATILFAGLPISTAFAQLQIAEDLLISLDASTYQNGAPWVSTGSLPASFLPFATPIKVNDVAGAGGVLFDGVDYFIGPASPATLHEANATYSIESWVYNGHLRGEESIIAWGQRGSDNTNVSFNYGNNSSFGAMGHWGAADMGWGFSPEDGSDLTPEAGKWHHLVYTYDGAGTQRVYSDGVLTSEEIGVSLDPRDGFSLQLGAQRESNNTIATANTLSAVLGKVRVHAGTLTPEQILNNYNFEKAQYPNVTVPQPLERAPINRYTFDGLVNADDRAIVPDVISGKDAEIRGPGALVTEDGKGVQLPGGDQNSSYIDLPNGIISGTIDGGTGYGSASYEAWVTVLGNNHWSRIMDFGSSGGGEVTDPGGAAGGTNFVFLSANVDSNDNMAMERGGGAGSGQRQSPISQNFGTEMHVVLSYDAELLEWRWFQNGKLMESFFSDGSPLTINDVNNWLGRSNFGQDGNFGGIFNEFRIYDYALTQRQIVGNFLAGPDTVIPEPGSAVLLGLGATLMGVRRRRKS